MFGKNLVGLFSLSFELENLVIAIIQIETKFECRINSYPFNYLIELEKNKTFYKKIGGSPAEPSKRKQNGKNSSKFILNLSQKDDDHV